MTLAELIIKITADSSDAERGIAETEQKASKLGTSFGKVASGIGKGAKVIGSAVAAGAAAVGKLALDATKAYAEYEQQVGGVQKLFGDAADQVVKDAKEAYKTAGVDANTYMQNVTSFSASLINGLGGDTKKAAEVSNRAMNDMADNANTFGTNIQSIQNAYQGFAKQNYMMLDNLKLGYGGTKTEMQRLIQDAAQMTEIQKELNLTVDEGSMSFDNIINAISVMQANLNIAGTTAKEAGSTIQGSLNMMRSAWENLKIALADPEGDVSGAMQDLISSAKTFAENAAPVFSKAVRGIGTAVKELAPVISEELPGLVGDILPDLISAGTSLVSGIATAIVENAPMIVDGFGQILQSAGEAFSASDNPIFKGVGELLTAVGDLIRDPQGTLSKAWDTVKSNAAAAWEGIKATAQTAWETVSDFFSSNVIEPTVEWVNKKWEDIVGAYEEAKSWIINKAVTWSNFAFEKITTAYNTVKNWIIEKSVTWVSTAFDTIVNAYNEIKSWVIEKAVKFFEEGFATVQKVIDEIPRIIPVTVSIGVRNAAQGAVEGLTGADSETAAGIVDAVGNLSEAATGVDIFNPLSVLGNFLGFAKGEWSVPHDMPAMLHRDEMVLSASQARRYREGEAGSDISTLAGVVSDLKNTLANLKIYVGSNEFGRTVVDYSGDRMNGYLNTSTTRVNAGYGY